MILEMPLDDNVVQLKSLDETAPWQAYLSWMKDPEITCFLESRFSKHSEETLRDFVKVMRLSQSALLAGIFFEERHVGNIKLQNIPHHARGEIGILIGEKQSWGKGIGRRAILLLADYAFKELGIKKLSAGCYGNNVGSINAFKAAGFEIEAVRKEHFITDDRRVDGVYLARFGPTVRNEQ